MGYALIDTGANFNAIDAETAKNLVLEPTGLTTTFAHGGGAQMPGVEYTVKVTLAGAAQGLWEMTAAPLRDLLGVIAVIGTETLSYCVFSYDGVNGSFTLAWT